jgi:hypothetical protein
LKCTDLKMCPYPSSTCLQKLCTTMTWCLVVAQGILTCRLCGFGNYIMETLSPNGQLWAKPNILTLIVAKHSKVLKSVQKIWSPKASINASMCVLGCYVVSSSTLFPVICPLPWIFLMGLQGLISVETQPVGGIFNVS